MFPREHVRRFLLFAALVGLAWFSYRAVWPAGFIWDDDSHLTANPCVVGPLGLKEAWTTAAGNYYPLVATHFRVLYRIWGPSPFPYHVVTWLMHVGCALLLWNCLARLGVRGAWLGAAIWCVHPVQVESVAWISEFTNTQSGLFFLLAIQAFDGWLTRKGRAARFDWRYGLACLWTICAVTSKPSTVMLPVVFALCWWWRRISWRPKEALWLLPFACFGGLMSAWTVWEQKFHSGALGADWSLSLVQRLAVAGKDVWFYLFKLLWPHPLIFIYPRWSPAAPSLESCLPFLAAAGLLFWAGRSRRPAARPVFFAAACFVVLLFPVLGFFNVYFFTFSFVADHFQYLASMAPLALVGAGAATLASRAGRAGAIGVAALSACVLAGLSFLTLRQCGIYHDDEALFSATLRWNPSAWLAQNNLGKILLQEGKAAAAKARFEEAVRLKPDYTIAENNLAAALLLLGRPAEAISHFENVLRIDPNFAQVHFNLASELAKIPGRLSDALAHYETALRLDPSLAEAHNNLANELAKIPGRLPEALAHYEAAVRLKPDYAEAQNNLGLALARSGRWAEAIAAYGEALRLNPADAEARRNRGNALRATGRTAEAIADYEEAARLNPASSSIHYNLGLALAQAGRLEEAIEQDELALKLNPLFPEALNNLGVTLAKSGRMREALAPLEEAVRLQPDYGEAQANLRLLRQRLAAAPGP